MLCRAHGETRVTRPRSGRGAISLIPAHKSRRVRESVDTHIYALRNRIERCFNRLKNAPRVATRYDKTADSYRSFVQITSIPLRIRGFVNTP